MVGGSREKHITAVSDPITKGRQLSMGIRTDKPLHFLRNILVTTS